MAGDGVNRPVDNPSGLESRIERVITSIPREYFRTRPTEELEDRLREAELLIKKQPPNSNLEQSDSLEKHLKESLILPIFPVAPTQEVIIPDPQYLNPALESFLRERSSGSPERNVTLAAISIEALEDMLGDGKKIILDQFEPNIEPLSPSDLTRHPEANGDSFFYVKAIYPFYRQLRHKWREMMTATYGDIFIQVYDNANLARGNRLSEIPGHIELLQTLFGKGYQTPHGLLGGLNIPGISNELAPLHETATRAVNNYPYLTTKTKIDSVMRCEDAAIKTLQVLGKELGVKQTKPVKIT